MNQNFVTIIKRIIAEQGESILANPQALKGIVADYASRESKAERLAFGRCMEHGAYNALKDAPDAQTRQSAKAAVARRVHDNEGLDIALCNGALDVLEMALFGRQASSIPTMPAAVPVFQPISTQTPQIASESQAKKRQIYLTLLFGPYVLYVATLIIWVLLSALGG